MSIRNLLVLVSIPALLSACATTQESPIYQQSTKYKVHSPYTTSTGTMAGTATTQQAGYSTTHQAPVYQAPVTYTTSSSAPAYHQNVSSTGEVYTTQVNHECLDKEGNRKLIGAGLGGAAGALAGNHIGDTKGAIIGGIAGAAAGYGIADVTKDCDPIQVATPASTQAPVTYQSYQTTQPAGYHTVSSTTAEQTVTPQVENTTAPTDSAYGETFGTPGYHAMIANGELDETQTASVTVPEAPVVSTPIPAPQPAPVALPPVSYPQASIPAQPQYTAPAPTSQQYAQTGITMHKVVTGDTVYSLSRRLCVGVEDIRRLNSLNTEFYIRLDDQIRLPASRC